MKPGIFAGGDFLEDAQAKVEQQTLERRRAVIENRQQQFNGLVVVHELVARRAAQFLSHRHFADGLRPDDENQSLRSCHSRSLKCLGRRV